MAATETEDRTRDVAEYASGAAKVLETAGYDIGELVEDTAGEDRRAAVDQYLAERYGDGDPADVGNEEYIRALSDVAGSAKAGASYLQQYRSSDEDALTFLNDTIDDETKQEAAKLATGAALGYAAGSKGYAAAEVIYEELAPRAKEWAEENDVDGKVREYLSTTD